MYLLYIYLSLLIIISERDAEEIKDILTLNTIVNVTLCIKQWKTPAINYLNKQIITDRKF